MDHNPSSRNLTHKNSDRNMLIKLGYNTVCSRKKSVSLILNENNIDLKLSQKEELSLIQWFLTESHRTLEFCGAVSRYTQPARRETSRGHDPKAFRQPRSPPPDEPHFGLFTIRLHLIKAYVVFFIIGLQDLPEITFCFALPTNATL